MEVGKEGLRRITSSTLTQNLFFIQDLGDRNLDIKTKDSCQIFQRQDEECDTSGARRSETEEERVPRKRERLNNTREGEEHHQSGRRTQEEEQILKW